MYYDTYGCSLVNNYDIEIGEGGGAIVLLSIIVIFQKDRSAKLKSMFISSN